MFCPVCGAEMRRMDRTGVEIDICPQCRGVWLDRGELDKLIDRAAHGLHDDDSDYGERRYDHHAPPPKKKKEGFLGRFFDFD
jgi:uncharacterized protein